MLFKSIARRLLGATALGVLLQFASGACILDAYLYPPQGGGEQRVTHIDARRSDGAEVDRVSCVNALRLR